MSCSIKIAEKKHELASGGGKDLDDILEVANEHLVQIQKPKEGALDAEIFMMVTNSGAQLAKALVNGDAKINPADFIRRLKTRYVDNADAQDAGASDPRAFNWAKLARTRLSGWFAPPPVCFHMLGPMDAAPVVKAKRPAAATQRQKRQPPVKAVRPDDIGEDDDDEKQETDRNMDEMWSALRARSTESAPLVELVLNHKSFAQTVENLFALSFLVRDARVELRPGADGEGMMVFRKVKQNRATAEREATEAERVQFVTRLDVEIWEEWKLVVDEEATMMKHRAPVTDDVLANEEHAGRSRQQQSDWENNDDRNRQGLVQGLQ